MLTLRHPGTLLQSDAYFVIAIGFFSWMLHIALSLSKSSHTRACVMAAILDKVMVTGTNYWPLCLSESWPASSILDIGHELIPVERRWRRLKFPFH